MKKQVKIKQEYIEQIVKSEEVDVKPALIEGEESSGEVSSEEWNSQYSERQSDETGYNMFLLREPDYPSEVKSYKNGKGRKDYEISAHNNSDSGNKKRRNSLLGDRPSRAKQVRTEIKQEAHSSADQEDQGTYCV